MTPADRKEARRLIVRLCKARERLRDVSAKATVIDFEAGLAVAAGATKLKHAIEWLEAKLRHG